MTGPPGQGGRSALHGDRGSGSVLLLTVVLVALAMTTVVAALVRVQSARSSAQAAADLAALAAAGELALPPGLELAVGVRLDVDAACARAVEVAERNGARVAVCSADPAGVVLVEAVHPTIWGEASASSVAGPTTARFSPARR